MLRLIVRSYGSPIKHRLYFGFWLVSTLSTSIRDPVGLASWGKEKPEMQEERVRLFLNIARYESLLKL